MKGLLYKDVSIMTRSFKGNILLLVALYGVLILVTREAYLAYAMTVHKSQGSEFQAVIIPMFPGPSQLYYRNLLYTAITRAKSLLILAGTKETIYRMVENNRKTKRYTGLLTFLGGGEQNNHEQ